MLHVLGCITGQHDLRLVVLAAVLCLFACTTAMTMIARGQAATTSRIKTLWLVNGGVVAGTGIWGLHFVAMLAYRSGLPVAYDLPETMLSIVIAASLCAVGFRVALSRFGGALGGMITGSAISAMHYVGMAAVRIPARAHWDVGYVAASLVIGVILTTAALHIAVRRKDVTGYTTAAGLFLVAIVGMHFTAMSAVVYIPDSSVVVSGVVIAPDALAIAVAASVALIMALGLIGAIVDHHLALRASGEAERLRAHVRELEETKDELESTSEHLRNALLAADDANRAKSQFLAAMSHELRTPLNAIIGFSELLSTEVFGPLGDARYPSYVKDIHASGMHLLSLINDILDLSKLDSGGDALQEEDVAIEDLIETPLRMVQSQAAKGSLRISQDIEDTRLVVRVDKRRMQQVLINLLSNAVKFTPANGTIAISAHRSDEGLRIAVADTGIGIAAGDIPKAFELFRQIDSRLARNYEGAGLGLPLARKLAELHGGRLTLESALHKGTTATVLIPASRVVSAALAAA